MKRRQLVHRIRHGAESVVALLRKHQSQKQLLVTLALIVGTAAGFGAFVLKWLIGLLTAGVTGDNYTSGPVWWVVALPVVGFVMAYAFSRYVVHDNLEHGCEKIHADLSNRVYRLKPHLCYSPIVACALSLSFGGSAGSEGPIAYTGAGLGSNLGRLFGLEDDKLRILIGVGAGAGIAGIFKAPIGGALFTLEVLGMQLTSVTVLALISGCLAASTVAYVCSGFTLDVIFKPTMPFSSEMFLGVVALGIFCGIYSLYYSFMMVKTEKVVERVRSPWVRAVSTGLLVGAMLLVFPPLYGEGYGFIDKVINGDNPGLLNHSMFMDHPSVLVISLFLVGIVLVKSIATSATNSGGGVGGDFAPTLFAGCMAGMLFSIVSNTLLGTHFCVADFAFFGMAGVMAGAIQAPLMAIFLTVEMAGDFQMFFPLMVAGLVSYFTVRLLHRRLHVDFRPTWIHRDLKKVFGRW